MWRVVVCDQETSQARRLKPIRGRQEKKKSYLLHKRGTLKHPFLVFILPPISFPSR